MKTGSHEEQHYEQEFLYGNSLSLKKGQSSKEPLQWMQLDDNEDFNRLRRMASSISGKLGGREIQEFMLLEHDLRELQRDIDEVGWEQLDQRERDEYTFKKKVIDYVTSKGYRRQKKAKHHTEETANDKKSANYVMIDDHIDKEGRIDVSMEMNKLKKRSFNQQSEKDWHDLQQQRASGMTKFSNLKKDTVEPKQEYEYVFKNDGISFVHEDGDEIEELNEEDANIMEKVELEEALLKEEERVKSIEETRRFLPVFQYREDLLKAIEENPVLIIVGETGSGKTTQLPQYLYESGYCKNNKRIGCTQPRRVAAVSVATRVADEVGCKVGQEVGYTVRFDDKSGTNTKIKYMTDGMLLREFLTDVELDQYSVMMIDEAHERTLSTDILLGLLKEVVHDRKDFKLLIASATINAQKFSDYFDGAPIFTVPGRRFGVDIYYTQQPEVNYVNAATTTVMQIHMSQGKGDVLVFLTGQDEIESMSQTLQELVDKLRDQIKPMMICPIYANLPAEQQKRIFDPTPDGTRKVVIATNIAETSLTINGIVYVVDSGYVKENVFKPLTGIESLEVKPCSRASADQRAGRAGRVGPGKCFRLYTKGTYMDDLPLNPEPEILRVDLTGVVLLMMSLGISDLIHFDFMDAPATKSLMKALEELYALGALNEKGQLTRLGGQMCKFPTSPKLAKALITSSELNCTHAVLTVVAMLEEAGSVWINSKTHRERAQMAHKRFYSAIGGDHITLLNVWEEWRENVWSSKWCSDNYIQVRSMRRVKSVRNQLAKTCMRMQLISELDQSVDTGPLVIINAMKALTAGFFLNTATLSGDSYKTVAGQQVWIHPSSSLFAATVPPRVVLFHELVLTTREFMRCVMPVRDEWLHMYGTHDAEQKSG